MPKPCVYCGSPANSDEHIIASQFIELLAKDPRGFPVPTHLYVNEGEPDQLTIKGKRTKRGGPTVEYTARVCSKCNNEWMNDIDNAAAPFLNSAIQGQPFTLDRAMQRAAAVWMMKVAVTARLSRASQMPIDPAWSHWLYSNHSPIHHWHVWIGRYVGEYPLRYKPHDIRLEPGRGSAPIPDAVAENHGMYGTLMIGYLVMQVLGIGPTWKIEGNAEPLLVPIWPCERDTVAWPPAGQVDTSGLIVLEQRLLAKPEQLAPQRTPPGPNRAERRARKNRKP
jgi:hypothetical protein